jgi:aryl-alcohol dehydrogenase-like predicted oxidoreductase
MEQLQDNLRAAEVEWAPALAERIDPICPKGQQV